MNHRLSVVLALVVGVIGLGACSGTTPGSGRPADTTPVASSSSDNGAPSGDNGAKLASMQPCDLLNTSDLSQLGLSNQGTSKNESGARSCSWQHLTDTSGNGYLASVNIRDQQGIKDINTDGVAVTDQPIGRHQGRLLKDTSGGDGCSIVIGITDSSRVDIQANTNAATVDAACQLAQRVAPLVEARLP